MFHEEFIMVNKFNLILCYLIFDFILVYCTFIIMINKFYVSNFIASEKELFHKLFFFKKQLDKKLMLR